jgi:hypothetical protein
MAKGKEWKTAFCTRYGLFESLVMLFGLTNTPVIFQNYINDILAPYLDHSCTTYLDDTLIYSNNFEEHQQYVHLVLDAFAKVGLYLKSKKYEFHQQEVKYLWLIISMEGIKIDQENIRAMQDWEPPSNLKDICTFLGLANFYHCFICNYSHIVQLLTFLTCKGVPFAWSMEQQIAFDILKATFTSAPILAHSDPDQDSVVEMDASDYVSTSVLSQYHDNNVLYPMTYFSKKHSPLECNSQIYDKELMAII